MYFQTRKKGLSKTAESLVSLVAGPTRLELATSGVTDIYKVKLFVALTKTQRVRV